MAIAASDLIYYLTGASSDGGAQTNPALSTGNYRSSTVPTSAADNNLFDDISGAEATAGDTEYRCFCFKNTHASLSLTDAKFYISASTFGTQTTQTISIAVEVPTGGDTNGTCQTIANESTTPVVNAGNCSNWSTGTNYTNGVAVNIGAHDANLDAGEICFIWVKRQSAAGIVAASSQQVALGVQGDTAA